MATRPQRDRIFVAFEGVSENAFCAWLQDLCNNLQLNVHLDRPRRMRGGDPLALVQCALKARQRSKQRAGLGHRQSCLLIDTDRLDDGSARSREAIVLAKREKLVLIRQHPCFEAVLLRMHTGRERAVPATSKAALSEVEHVWPEYQKPPRRDQLAARFSLVDLQRLAAVEPELNHLLQILGFPAA